jgi:hypothetical protein
MLIRSKKNLTPSTKRSMLSGKKSWRLLSRLLRKKPKRKKRRHKNRTLQRLSIKLLTLKRPKRQS